MSVTLGPELEAQIQRRIDDGAYNDAREVVQRAMELLEQREKLEHLRALLAEGEEGEGELFTPELMKQINRDADEMLRQGIEPNPVVCP